MFYVTPLLKSNLLLTSVLKTITASMLHYSSACRSCEFKIESRFHYVTLLIVQKNFTAYTSPTKNGWLFKMAKQMTTQDLYACAANTFSHSGNVHRFTTIFPVDVSFDVTVEIFNWFQLCRLFTKNSSKNSLVFELNRLA